MNFASLVQILVVDCIFTQEVSKEKFHLRQRGTIPAFSLPIFASAPTYLDGVGFHSYVLSWADVDCFISRRSQVRAAAGCADCAHYSLLSEVCSFVWRASPTPGSFYAAVPVIIMEFR